jgi:HPt (histidine-containing phosphotransfer) domain-containing protein
MAKNAERQPETGAPEAVHTHGPIDMEHLGRQALGDPGLQQEILRLYDQMSKIYFSRIEQSTNTDDLARNLHTLKSAASGIGAWTVRDLTRIAEEELRAGKVDPERIDDIEMAVNACSEFIASVVDDADAA